MRASVAASDITPKSKPDLCGYAARQGKTQGIHDRLYTKWLYLADEKNQALVSSNDLIGFSRSFYQRLCIDIARTTGVPAANINAAAVHTHSGPATVSLRRCGQVDPQYVRTLRQSMLATAQKAAAARTTPVEVGVAIGKVDASVNRRDQANGLVDDTFAVIVLKKARTDKPLAVLCSYACHAVVMGSENLHISGDYTSSLQKMVENETGAKCLFLNGASGDINPKVAHSIDYRDAVRMGEKLGHKALSMMRKLQWIEEDSFQCTRHSIALPVHVPGEQELQEMADAVAKVFCIPPDLFDDRFAKYRQQIADSTFPRNIEATLSLLAFGSEVGFVFIPGEVFTEIGMQIKRMSPFHHTFVVGYSNGLVGYMPTRKAYEAGGYEPYLAPLFYGFPRYEPSVEETVIAGIEKLFAKAEVGEAVLA